MVLDSILDKFSNSRAQAFEEYTKFRNPDAEAICDLALYNYIEVGLNKSTSPSTFDVF